MGKQFLIHLWHPSCYSSYNPGDKALMRKGPESAYDKWSFVVVQWYSDIRDLISFIQKVT